MVNDLMKPGEFQRANNRLFRTYSALRYHLDRRGDNGLLDCGAVVESPLGLLIDPAKFECWLLRRASTKDAA